MRRTPPSSSAFTRLLCALNDVHAPASNDAFAQRLSHWFGWTDAISLSAALDSPAPHVPPAFESAQAPASAEERELARVKAMLAKTIAAAASSGEPARVQRPTPRALAAPDAPLEFTPYRHAYATTQQAIDISLAPLRRRLRAALTGASPDLARLASLDTVMEQVLGARERALLATVPQWLERRFERLRHEHDAADADEDTAATPRKRGPPPWLATFHQDMRALLLAELDLRLQPVEGLVAALRGPSPVKS
ncbi:MAG: DUF3348 domain-containing protein [Betaproteobacteria bacterium]